MSSIQHVPQPAEPERPIAASEVPRVYYPYPVAPPRREGPSLVTLVLLAMLLLVLTMGAIFLVAMVSMLGAGGRAMGDVGQRAGEVARSAGETATRLGQDVRDRFDPSHPPREALLYDTEIEDFVKVGLGQALPGGARRAFTVTEIRSRPDGGRPETGRYAVIHSELREPNETKVLGITVRRDSEPRDDYLYQGEAFRIGGRVYKVNWISPERQQLALIQVRDPDRAGMPLKFVYE
jgi:hypothetical protein